jgi:hypothetical protein
LRLDASFPAGAVAVAAVEDHALVEHYRLDEAVDADVVDQRGELAAFEQWKYVGKRVIRIFLTGGDRGYMSEHV